MYQALYRKYRPQTLEEIGGQDSIVKIIKNSIEKNKINHAYLFAGPRGTGKTSIAKIFAKMVNCEDLNNGIPCGKCPSCTQINNSDIIEIDAASNNGVDEIRELRNKVNLVPSYGKYKVYIIDEVHMLTTGAFNALLKTLEEPPAHIIFVLATTDPHKIPETILSRCQRLDFKKISTKSIVKRLKEIATLENIDIEDDALEEIARISDGGMRDSIGMLDQAIAYAENKVTIDDIHDINGTLTATDIEKLVKLIVQKNIEEIFKKLDKYNDDGKNFVKLTEEIIEFLRNTLLFIKAEDYCTTIITNCEPYKEIKQNITTKEILKYINILNQTLNDMKITNNTKLLLELAVIKMLEDEPNEENPRKTVENKTSVQNTQNIKPSTTVDIQPKPIEKVEKPNINIQKQPVKTETPPVAPQETKPQKIEITKIDLEKLNQLKQQRINNTLAKFNKRELNSINQKLVILNDFLLDPDISKYASIILDGILKAASDENLIFVYKTERTASLFNENIQNIEETIEKVLKKKYKVIATDADNWEIIKNEFNSRKRTYTYTEETINIKDIFEGKATGEFSEFEDIIEYN